MKLKSLIVALLVFFSATTHAQLTVDVFINGLKSGQYIIKDGETEGGIWYKKSVYKNMSQFVIEVKGKVLNNAAYKRAVEVVDDNSKSLLVAAEAPTVLGQFTLTDKAIAKRLGKGKMVKLFLQMDPASPTSKLASRRIFIGNFTAK